MNIERVVNSSHFSFIRSLSFMSAASMLNNFLGHVSCLNLPDDIVAHLQELDVVWRCSKCKLCAICEMKEEPTLEDFEHLRVSQLFK